MLAGVQPLCLRLPDLRKCERQVAPSLLRDFHIVQHGLHLAEGVLVAGAAG